MNLQSTDFELFGIPQQFAQDRAVLDARWKEFLAYEAQVIQNYGKRETIHG